MQYMIEDLFKSSENATREGKGRRDAEMDRRMAGRESGAISIFTSGFQGASCMAFKIWFALASWISSFSKRAE
jgi:hypothetical protein